MIDPATMTIQAAAATINTPPTAEGAHASPQDVPGALATLGYAVGALGLYAGSRAPLRLGRAVSLSIMECTSEDGILHADINVHGPTPELVAWMEAEGATSRDNSIGRTLRLLWETLILTAFVRAAFVRGGAA